MWLEEEQDRAMSRTLERLNKEESIGCHHVFDHPP